MAKHKKQHFVPQSYLRAWCDPEAPAGQTPYVWRFSKDGSIAQRKAPEKIFHERDLYTIPMPDGGRDLRLERGLSQLEGAFVKVRDAKLARQKPLDEREGTLLCAFVAASHARTPMLRDHFGEFWSDLLAKGNEMQEWAKTATPAQRRALGGVPPSDPDRSFSLSLEEVQEMAEAPLQTMLVAMVRELTPLLAQLDLLVFTTTDSPGFLTSDNPCVWFDADAYRRPPLYQGVGAAFPGIEITLPVSPRQLLVFHRHGPNGYVPVTERAVDEMNRRTRFGCGDYFVTNANVTRPIWFDPGEEPEDSWRKLHPEPGSP
jgi:uncharacterized protein DUF4238